MPDEKLPDKIDDLPIVTDPKDSAGGEVIATETNGTTQTVELPPAAIQAIVQIANRFHQGPIPDAESFEKYEHALAGAGDRILAMAEKDQDFRISQSPIQQRREFIGRMSGQAIGFVSLMVIVGSGALIAYNSTSVGQITFACALIAAPVFMAVERATDFFRNR
jgi:uncharacterized membrane protein